MFKPFVCGTASFRQEEEEDDTTPRKSRSNNSRSRSNNNKNKKNPYSMRGLDKFAKVLADLDERRQKIYEQMGSQDISMVRFGYSNSKGWVPIVVKFRDQKQDNIKFEDRKEKVETHNSEEQQTPRSGTDGRTRKRRSSFPTSVNKDDLTIVIVVILLCLVMYGRSIAIVCTSIWWYLRHALKGGNSNSRPLKKKECVRRLSEKKIEDGVSSPKSENLKNGFSPRRHSNVSE